jgi:hypothetical protein
MLGSDSASENGHKGKKNMKHNGMCGSFYGLTFIGAAVYFIGHATSFWGGVLGLFKALVWPAFVIYKALELLGM